ncbi:EamA family transporter [Nesterenkonia xinjiangensis]|uniref:Inner membrane transporter RhtA n=1 Tax=Nesterenkonia xinjiangensis TaxID=225327 RepID=A0A7Z0K857_9MICC|nr:EamA family transporter [Nesterenkonia xinjiangensis]NYJ77301.1 inner membrane transporter RhtA [Nesterenkonia xinjiangensis]
MSPDGTASSPSSDGGRRTQGSMLVLLGLACQQIGAALAVLVFPAAGPVGMVALRLLLSAGMLWALVRPHVRGLSARSWAVAAGYGLVLAGMNVAFYLALARLPLGTTVTLEILGPLTLSIIAGRSWLSALWAVAALVGVAMIGWDPATALDPVGVAYALLAAALWAAYILLTKRTGEEFTGLIGLTLGMTVGGLAVAPAAVMLSGPALLDPAILMIGLGVALLSSTVPYAMEMLALRRLPASSFAILLALAPAIAAAAGFLLLGQQLSGYALLGMGLVVLAAMGSVRS